MENSHNESDAKPDIFNRRPKLHDVYCSPGVHRAPILKVPSDSEFVVESSNLCENTKAYLDPQLKDRKSVV